MVVNIQGEGQEVNLKTNPCSGCGKPIFFGQNEKGKIVPLDPSAPVYRVEVGVQRIKLIRSRDSFVSHFCTCSHVNDFSSSRKKEGAGDGKG